MEEEKSLNYQVYYLVMNSVTEHSIFSSKTDNRAGLKGSKLVTGIKSDKGKHSKVTPIYLRSFCILKMKFPCRIVTYNFIQGIKPSDMDLSISANFYNIIIRPA